MKQEDKQQNYELAEKLLSEQNLAASIIVGAVATVLAAVSYVSFVDLVFWFVAVWFAVFLVKRPLSRSERLAIGMYESRG